MVTRFSYKPWIAAGPDLDGLGLRPDCAGTEWLFRLMPDSLIRRSAHGDVRFVGHGGLPSRAMMSGVGHARTRTTPCAFDIY